LPCRFAQPVSQSRFADPTMRRLTDEHVMTRGRRKLQSLGGGRDAEGSTRRESLNDPLMADSSYHYFNIFWSRSSRSVVPKGNPEDETEPSSSAPDSQPQAPISPVERILIEANGILC
jgi:hypothetical protein